MENNDEILSTDEVEQLLQAMKDSPAAGAAAPAKRSGGAPGAQRAAERVTPYDFKRPERVGKEQMRSLQSMHEGFGRNFAASLSGLLRSIVEVKLTSVDQLTYSEFVFSLENPTCYNLLSVEPLEGNFILEFNPSILYPIIDRLLGGGKESGPVARRPLTEIELRLVSRITDLFRTELKKAWAGVVEIEPLVDRVESNPQLVQVVPPNEVVVLISYEITLGDVRGMMNFCIPFNSIERVSNKLASNSWVTYGRSETNEETVRHLSERLKGSQVKLTVNLAQSTITASDLLGLRVGDIITTDHDVQAPLEVCVENIPKFAASPGAYKGHKAVQIERVLGSA